MMDDPTYGSHGGENVAAEADRLEHILRIVENVGLTCHLLQHHQAQTYELRNKLSINHTF